MKLKLQNIFQSLTSFMLFLLLLGITHVQDIIETVEDDLEQLEESNWVVGQLQGLSVYFNNNEQKMLSGQNLASCEFNKHFNKRIENI